MQLKIAKKKKGRGFSGLEKQKNKKNKMSSFIPASTFTSSKPGYVFKLSTLGLGYHLDPSPVPSSSSFTTSIVRDASTLRQQSKQTTRKTPSKHNASTSGISSWKSTTLKLERLYTLNAHARVSNPNDPTKWIESEFDLHESLLDCLNKINDEKYRDSKQFNKVDKVALYHLGFYGTVVEMLGHENPDIQGCCMRVIEAVAASEMERRRRRKSEEEEEEEEDDLDNVESSENGHDHDDVSFVSRNVISPPQHLKAISSYLNTLTLKTLPSQSSSTVAISALQSAMEATEGGRGRDELVRGMHECGVMAWVYAAIGGEGARGVTVN